MEENKIKTQDYERFMQEALKEAEKAKNIDEVPVGCVIVKDGKIIAKSHNQKNKKNNSLYHAEIIALNKAMKKLNDWHLLNCQLFVTLEPCPMCAGAIINSRVGTVVFGASDPKAGCFESVFDFCHKFNHTPNLIKGILEKPCGEILTNYFKTKRKSKNGN
ncbi:MAG: nucleoside deaminase [Clostridia bacterium]|nr:nucleoside deaminase [Clostridia bacterium]